MTDIDQTSSGAAPRDRALRRVAAAREALDAGRPERARAMLDAVLRRAPGLAPARLALARTLLGLGRPEAASEAASIVLAADPGACFGWILKGRAEAALGRPAAAEAAFRRAAALRPDRVRTWALLAEAALAGGRREAAEAALEAGAAAAPDADGLRMRLGRLRFEAGRAAEAVEALAAVDPAGLTDEALVRLAEAWALCGEPSRAAEALGRIDAAGPHAGARLLFEAAAGRRRPLAAARALAAAADGPGRDAFAGVLRRLSLTRGPWADRLRARMGRRDEAGPSRDALTLERAGYGEPGEGPSVSVLCPVHRPEDLGNLARQLARQTLRGFEVVAVADGPAMDPERLRVALAGAGIARLTVLRGRGGLPRALNDALGAASGRYAARFDADDRYLPGYLARTAAFMVRHRAALCGRTHVAVHWTGFDATALVGPVRHAYAPRPARAWHAMGSTLMVEREAALSLGFDEGLTLGEDADFYRRAHGRRLSAVAAPFFDHVVVRREGPGRHTWRTTEVDLLSRAAGGVWVGPLDAVERRLEDRARQRAAPFPQEVGRGRTFL